MIGHVWRCKIFMSSWLLMIALMTGRSLRFEGLLKISDSGKRALQFLGLDEDKSSVGS